MKKSDFTIIKLRAQYAVLSEVCESFTPNSKHDAYKKIDTMMSDILTKLEKNKNENSKVNQKMEVQKNLKNTCNKP